MSERLAKKLLIIGWDAADWKVINQLFERDLMPNLHRLIQRGTHADLSTLEPKLSPILWTSIATGKTADKHGILNFIEPNPSGEGLRISSSTTRRTKALWNILTQAGLSVNVISWYASHPSEPIRGVCVSNLFQENVPATSRDAWSMPDGAVHPKEMAAKIAKQRMHPAQLADSMLRPMIARLNKIPAGDARLKTLRKLIAQCYSVHRAALAVLAAGRGWDCTMLFYDSIDTVGHHFMEFHPPRLPHIAESEFDLFHNVMSGVYQLHDLFLGELLKAAGPDVTVMLLSDHGFYCDELRPVTAELPQDERAAIEAAWHRPFGVLAMAGPGVVTSGERLPGASILDITPTALTLLGVPVGQDMDGSVLTSAFDREVQIERHPNWDEIPGEAGLHPTEMRQDPFESQDAMKQLVDLGYIAALSDNAQAMLDLTRRETQFNLAMVYMTTLRPTLAMPIFQDLVTHHPQETRYALSLARCLFSLMKWEDCVALLRDFLIRKPDNLDARFVIAAALGSGGQLQEAAKELEKLEQAAAGSERRKLQVPLGDAYSVLHRWVEAEQYYREALAVDPRNPHVLYGLSRALLAQEKFDDAVDHCLDALDVQHVFPEGHHLLGVALAWMGDESHAIQSFKVALSMRPGLIDAHQFLALIYRKLNDNENAQHYELSAKDLLASANAHANVQEAPMGPREWAARHGVLFEGAQVNG